MTSARVSPSRRIGLHLGNRKQAEARLTELVGQVNTQTFAEPTKITVLGWLRSWLEKYVKPPARQPATYELYHGIVETYLRQGAGGFTNAARGARAGDHHLDRAPVRAVDEECRREADQGARDPAHVRALLLQAGVLPHVVAARLGHSVEMLMTTYAHALPDQQQDAAVRLGNLLRG